MLRRALDRGGHTLKGDLQVFNALHGKRPEEARAGFAERLDVGPTAGQRADAAQQSAGRHLRDVGAAPQAAQALHPASRRIGGEERSVDRAHRRAEDEIRPDVALRQGTQHAHLMGAQYAATAQNERDLTETLVAAHEGVLPNLPTSTSPGCDHPREMASQPQDAPAARRRDHARDEALLAEVLHDVIRASDGEAAVQLLDDAVALGRSARGGDEAAAERLAELVAGLDLERTEVLVRSLTRWFQLVNLAEDNERVRRIRQRERRDAPAPRPGSVRQVIAELAAREVPGSEVAALLRGAELRLVMTAHPTESRRRTTINKLARVFGVLRELDEVSDADLLRARRRLLATVQELWGSDELRAASLTVLDEVRGGLIHFTSTLSETVPQIYRDLEEALVEYYPEAEIDVPGLLKFGSWIGGDRDGNPYVTPEMTEEALELMREQCLRMLEARVGLLAGRLSISERVSGPAPKLGPILAEGAELFPGWAVQLAELNPEEPYRRALTFMRERVRATRRGEPGAYAGPDELLADLRLVERSLRAGPGTFTAAGDLHDVIREVEVFGFHFARLDIRETPRSTAARWPRSTPPSGSAKTTKTSVTMSGSRCCVRGSPISARSCRRTSPASRTGHERPSRPSERSAGPCPACIVVRFGPTSSRVPRVPRICSKCCC